MEPRVYHLSRLSQVIYGLIGLCFVGSAAFLLTQEFSTLALLIAVPLSLPGIFCWRWCLRSRLALSETEISVRYVFGEHRAQLSEIKSWRATSGPRAGSFWVLQLRDSSDSLSIDQRFAVDDVFLGFLSGLRNLNESKISVGP